MLKYYNTISRLSKTNVIILIALCVVSMLSIWAVSWNYSLVESMSSGTRVSVETATKSDNFVSMSGGLLFIVVIIQIFIFMIWVYKFQKGLPIIKINDARWSPSWCVAWWFIPIMSLFRPYQVIAQFWRATSLTNSPTNWKSATVPSLLMVWWITSVIATWFAMIYLRLSASNWNSDRLEDYLSELSLSIFSDASVIISSVLLIYVIKGTTEQLKEKITQLEKTPIIEDSPFAKPESKEKEIKDFEIVAKQKPLKEKPSSETTETKPSPPKIEIITKKKT
jgi:hypothetical protein